MYLLKKIFPFALGIFGVLASKTVATLGASEGGARRKAVGGIAPQRGA